jgi:hypothetical protein
MIFRLSAKLASKLKVVSAAALPRDVNPYADWSANLFTAGRAQYLIVTNTVSLYSVLVHGRGISSGNQFVQQTFLSLQDFLDNDGLSALYGRVLAPAGDVDQFSKALNRSVTGSMNDLVVHAKMWLVEKNLSLPDIAARLNDIPFSPLGYRKPREAFVAMEAARHNEA